ncbi:hypothetical protein HYZ80_01465 [Candidatus Parcubacteria bacterium]|nr:hypothetical protein [Candidatus Parcubacteria bacterium]
MRRLLRWVAVGCFLVVAIGAGGALYLAYWTPYPEPLRFTLPDFSGRGETQYRWLGGGDFLPSDLIKHVSLGEFTSAAANCAGKVVFLYAYPHHAGTGVYVEYATAGGDKGFVSAYQFVPHAWKGYKVGAEMAMSRKISWDGRTVVTVLPVDDRVLVMGVSVIPFAVGGLSALVAYRKK